MKIIIKTYRLFILTVLITSYITSSNIVDDNSRISLYYDRQFVQRFQGCVSDDVGEFSNISKLHLYELIKAIQENDFDLAKSTIISSKSMRLDIVNFFGVRVCDPEAVSLLESACEYQRWNIVRLLIHHGAIIPYSVAQKFDNHVPEFLKPAFQESIYDNGPW